MAIPKLTKDLEIIQKLSDLPNATDGLTADELKAKFDEAARLIKEYLNSVLVPAIAAKNIPFTKIDEINATDVQNAIAEVQRQVKDAANGAIPNESITKEKLAADLLARVYGGVPWLSVKTPDGNDNTDAGFPIGQIWLRPAFTVNNLRKTSWSGTGCTVAATEQQVKMTGNKSSTDGTMTQSLTGIGNEGDTVYILFDLTERDTEITALTLSINNGEETEIGEQVSEAVKLKAGGSVTMTVSATWPSMSLADGNVVLKNFTIVNVSAILRQTAEAKDMSDWVGYLRDLMPFVSYNSPTEIFIQTADGEWLSMMYDVLPVNRGGTGLDAVADGQLLYGSGGKLQKLDPPGEDDCALFYGSGNPQWKTRAQVVEILEQPRVMTGSYVGTGDDATPVTLPVSPILLYIRPDGGLDTSNFGNSHNGFDRPTVLSDGAEDGQTNTYSTETGYGWYLASVKLSGNTLTFSAKLGNQNHPYFMNRSGITYRWTALY